MAHPGFVVEQYVYHFLCQWRVGLQPSMTLNAKSNGEIDVSLSLTTSLPSNHDAEQFSTPSTRRSGGGSRSRRRRRRAAAQSSIEIPEVRICSDVGSEEDQCVLIEPLPADPPDLAELAMSVEFNTSIPQTSKSSHVPQDHHEATDEETTSNLDAMEETAAQLCSLCLNQVVLFSRRVDFLRHICVDHLQEEHLIDFPEFLPNEIFQQAMKLAI